MCLFEKLQLAAHGRLKPRTWTGWILNTWRKCCHSCFWIFRGLIKQNGMHQLLRGERPDLGVNLIPNVWTGILFYFGDGHCCCFTMPWPSCCSSSCFLTPLI